MVKFTVLTLFPETFTGFTHESILKRAIDTNKIKVEFLNFREFAKDKRKTVDDTPYGGGAGMVIRPDIVVNTLESITPKPYSILLSASGKLYNQKTAQILSKKSSIVLVCGHYEGIDARVEDYVDEVLSIGDFVLTGGEVAAMAVIDSVSRLIPGVIKKESASGESFSTTNLGPQFTKRGPHGSVYELRTQNLLEYPHYTRPEIFRGQKVPKVLLSGNHAEIKKWREEQALKRTKKYRPDLLKTK